MGARMARTGRPKYQPMTASPKRRGPRAKSRTFAGMIASERKRLQKARENVNARKRQIEQELADIARELEAIESFVRAKRGMPAGKTGQGSSAKRGAVRESILQ